ncbi:MAG: hypothetical protein WC543_06015 [Candidatus Omnitrophota bacterium]
MNNPSIDIAKIFGQPIDPALPVDPVLAEICKRDTLECGDNAYAFTSYDENVDTIYTAGDNGEVISNHKSPVGGVEIDMIGYQSDLAYVTLNEMSASKDQTALARKKMAITRGLNKLELKGMIDLILAITSQEVSKATGEDLYDGIMKMVHKINDYGENYVLLAGREVVQAIDNYDKENTENFSYRISIKEMLADVGVKVVKVLGSVKLDSGVYLPVLDPTKAILVARNSDLVDTKPCLLIRRKFNAELSKSAGVEGEAERLVTTIGGLQVINNSKNILGIGCFGYENIGIAVTNYLAICYCENLIS